MSEPVQVGRFHIRFQCQPGCINCCTQSGDVYLTEADIDRIAQHLGLARADFEQRHVRRTPDHARLRIPRQDSCPFLIEGGCGIHPVKPLQCRVFPFWPENIANRASWHKLRRYCPGVGVGSLVQIQTARAEAQAYRDAFPGL